MEIGIGRDKRRGNGSEGREMLQLEGRRLEEIGEEADRRKFNWMIGKIER